MVLAIHKSLEGHVSGLQCTHSERTTLQVCNLFQFLYCRIKQLTRSSTCKFNDIWCMPELWHVFCHEYCEQFSKIGPKLYID